MSISLKSPRFFSVTFYLRNVTGCALLVLIAALALPNAHAQTAHFSGAEITVPSSRLAYPFGIAVDPSRNVYIDDSGDKRIVKETAVDGGYTESVIPSGALLQSEGIAVDASQNIYAVTVEGLESLALKFTLSGGVYSQNSIGSGLNHARSIAVDANGNVYIADSGNNRVIKETSFSESYIQSVVPTSTLNGPAGLAVDAAGNLYIADTFNSRVLKETLTGGTYSESTIVSGVVVTGIAVDSGGTVYLSDPHNARVLRETPVGSGYVQSVVPSSGLGFAGLALDPSGNLYIADPSTHRVVEEVASAKFGTVGVGTPSAPISLLFTFDTGGTIASPAVLTQGISGLDFTDAGTGSCTAHVSTYVYMIGETCTIDVIFTPKAPGLRYGAAVLHDSSGAVIATGYVQGTGSGPRVNFPPGTHSLLSFSNITSPFALAVDGAGDLYIAQAAAVDSPNRVLKETWTGRGFTESTVASGLKYPVGVALDGAGNVFISDRDDRKVLKESPTNGGGYALTAQFTNLGYVEGVAVDGDGNVYIGSQTLGLVKESPTATGYVGGTITSGVYPVGIAVEGSGNVYFSQNDGQLFKDTLSNGSYTQRVIANGFGRAYGIALDGLGDLYVADIGNNSVVKETLAGGSYIQTTIASLGSVMSVTVDAQGNVFASNAENGNVWKIDLADPPTLTFASTSVGSTSSDSPQVATFANTGNAPLIFPAPSEGSNPSISSNFSLSSNGASACPLIDSSSQPGTLVAGASCQLSISFQPTTAGSLSGSLVATDNNLNAPSPAYVSQSLALNGTATRGTPTLTWTLPASATISYGTALSALQLDATSNAPGSLAYSPAAGTVLAFGVHTLSVTFTPTDTNAYTTATASVTLTVNQATPAITWSDPAAIPYGTALSATQLDATAPVPGALTYTSPLGTVLSAGTHTLTVTFTPVDTTNYTTATASVTLTVNQATPTITWSAPAAITQGTALSATQLDAIASVPGSFTYSPPLGAVLSAGAHPLAVTFAPTDAIDYTTATASVTLTVLTPVMPTLAFAPIATQVYGTLPFTVSAVSASSGAVTYTVVSGPATITGNLVTLTGVGTVVLNATQSASGSYTAATATVNFIVDASFTLSSGSSSGSASVAPGSAAAFSFTLTPGANNTFLDPITLSATGLPAGATATFSPASIAAGAAATSVKVTIQTANTQAYNQEPFPCRQTGSVALGLILLPLLGTNALRRRLRLMMFLAAVTLSLGTLLGLSGCAGGNSLPSSVTPPAQSYTVVVTAKDGTSGAQSSVNFMLTVQ